MSDWGAYAKGFARTRQLDPAHMRLWMARMADAAGVRPRDLPRLPWLDAGAGSGRFSRTIAEWWEREVVGLELRAAMLAQAERVPAVSRVCGDVRQPPFRRGAFAGCWVHLVLHQVADWPSAVRALAECLAPGGVQAVRTFDPAAAWESAFEDVFPTMQARGRSRWPTPHAIAEAMAAHLADVRTVAYTDESEIAPDEYIRQVEERAYSSLLDVPDAEFAHGLAALRAAHPPGSPPIRRTTPTVLIAGRR